MGTMIYGGTTLNGIIIQDELDDSYCYDYINEHVENFFVRLVQSYENGSMQTAHPALALFANDEPLIPLYAEVIAEDWGDIRSTDISFNGKFYDALAAFWKKVIADFNSIYVTAKAEGLLQVPEDNKDL